MVHIHLPSSNNVAEYEALINGLCITIELGIRRLNVRGDCQLVIGQVMKESSCHNTKMAVYYREVCQLEDKFNGLELNHIPRHLNEATNMLVKVAFGREPVLIGVFASDPHEPLVRYEEPEQAGDRPPTLGSGTDQPSTPSDPKVMELDEDPAIESDPLVDWKMPYLDYLLHEALLMDKTEAWRLTHHVKSFILIEGELYKCSHIGILQRCIPIEQGKRLLSDIHGGV
ncbi:uncharacterized protein [Miscanthus floridulus]|uniref:uncharacterized protein n=1 Tax=Miscanthus floridulus TaxID=154761 RepID=UPI00345B3336